MKNFTIYTFLFQLSLFFISPQVKFIFLSWNAIISSYDIFSKQVLSLESGSDSFAGSYENGEANSNIADSTLSFLSNYRL